MKVDRLDYYRNKLRGVPIADFSLSAWAILLAATDEAEAAEREACAAIFDGREHPMRDDYLFEADSVAAEIRARGAK